MRVAAAVAATTPRTAILNTRDLQSRSQATAAQRLSSGKAGKTNRSSLWGIKLNSTTEAKAETNHVLHSLSKIAPTQESGKAKPRARGRADVAYHNGGDVPHAALRSSTGLLNNNTSPSGQTVRRHNRESTTTDRAMARLQPSIVHNAPFGNGQLLSIKHHATPSGRATAATSHRIDATTAPRRPSAVPL